MNLSKFDLENFNLLVPLTKGFFLVFCAYDCWFCIETESRRSSQLLVKASSSDESSVDANELLTDLKEKWDAVENKTAVILYGGGAIVAVWLASTVVGAINSVPLLPKLMELVGLGYTGWFVYRYLLFKSSRKELATDIEAIKKKIAGTE
ncbi:hypothetical protein BUALT_Bualt01G0235400 [Buddleja alternifolia]|uniref:Cyanobacterial aminoacyl-tRNA synthetase CAAD domain-containing protein n=1 Tax=Buddleja alternifolia TaxID=168488 RepID=A0AAV6YBW0_9LAMI|nr:hypothetical protein BUALT_Bualt01G0235400 [Buddleja alternifolia]